jgi:eukaryotic-like serine/threonine-protein kinase
MADAAERELLFGLLAHQIGLIDQSKLVAAVGAWTRDRKRGLSEHLIGHGDLDADDSSALEALVVRHLKKHGNDIEKSLAAVPAGRSTREGLATVVDQRIEPSLARVGSATTGEDDDPYRTASHSVGAAASDGLRFRILRPHAQGGLGAVFVALDRELNREVALKQILDRRADDPKSRRRFLLEAQINGGLEHPGIVPVYGLGAYADGRPYYAMRFIRGDSLKEAIEQFHQRRNTNSPSRLVGEEGRGGGPGTAATSRDLELRKLLRRFTDVCNAVEYAHSRGVIHRDLKPANIIVGKHGETLVVDWGLAKAMGTAGAADDERTLMPSSTGGSSETEPGYALGTPAYMSPEQAEGRLDRLGPRSDVYSLGATLYCLLIGKAPFGGEPAEVIPSVQRGQFCPPSQIDPALDRALEAICLKAMALRPDDRYESPKALAEDIERWMADEPVSAWREPVSRRARRWARHNRTAVTALGVAILGGLVGLSAVSTVQARANTQLRGALNRVAAANAGLANSLRRESAANAELVRAQAAIQVRYDLAFEAIKAFHTGASEDFLLKQQQFKELRGRLLKSASDFYGKLGALLGKETDLASRRALGHANYELAYLTSMVGRPEHALESHRRVLAYFEALATETGASSDVKADVGQSLVAVAGELQQIGRVEEALASYRNAEVLLAGLKGGAAPSGESPSVRATLVQCQLRLGILLRDTGHTDEALVMLRKARAEQEELASAEGATAESRGDLAGTIGALASTLGETGKPEEALGELHKAIAIQRKLVDDNPAVTHFRSELAWSYNESGILLWHLGKLPEALGEYRAATAIKRKMADDNPAVHYFRNVVAAGQFNIAILLDQMGKPDEALAEYRSASAIWKELAVVDPSVTSYRSFLAKAHANIGGLLWVMGQSEQALTECRAAMSIVRKLVEENPTVTEFSHDLAASHDSAGRLLAEAGKSELAMDEFRAAMVINRKLVHDDPSRSIFRERSGETLHSIGAVLMNSGQPALALGPLREAIAIEQKLAEESPGTARYGLSLAQSATDAAEALLALDRTGDAKPLCEQAVTLLEPMARDGPADAERLATLAEALLRRGQVRRAERNASGADDDVRRAIALLAGLPSPHPRALIAAACCRAALSSLEGMPGSGLSTLEARAEADRAIDLLRQAVATGYRGRDLLQNDTALASLRSRHDFAVLMMDLAMPKDPFASH